MRARHPDKGVEGVTRLLFGASRMNFLENVISIKFGQRAAFSGHCYRNQTLEERRLVPLPAPGDAYCGCPYSVTGMIHTATAALPSCFLIADSFSVPRLCSLMAYP